MKGKRIVAFACAFAMLITSVGCSDDDSGSRKKKKSTFDLEDSSYSDSERDGDQEDDGSDIGLGWGETDEPAKTTTGVKLASPDDIQKFVNDFNNGNDGDDGGQGYAQTDDFQSSPSNPLTYENMTLERVSGGCDNCAEMLLLYTEIDAELQKLSEEKKIINYDKYFAEKLQRIEVLNQHQCNAKVVYVENMKYDYDLFFGYYTGYWKGSAPHGEGQFKGSTPYATGLNPNTNSDTCTDCLSYTGSWSYGSPEGQGQLYYYYNMTRINDYFNEYQQFYTGAFSHGQKNGKGLQHEIQERGYKGQKSEYIEWYYDQGNYADGKLTQNIRFAQYDREGNPKWSGIACSAAESPGRGIVEYKQRMHMDTMKEMDEAKARKQAALWMAGLVGTAAGIYLVTKIGGGSSNINIGSATPEQQKAGFDNWKQKQEELAKINEEQIQKQKEGYWYSKAKELDQKGLLDTPDGKWFAANGKYYK